MICRGFTPEQTLQLSTPTYRDRKDKKATASSSTPTLVDPANVSVLGKVEKVKAVQSTPTTAKKTKRSESHKKKSSSSRPSAEDLKQLDDKWAERFSRLEAMLLAKTFTVLDEPVVKPASDVTTSQKPFFMSADIMSSLCGVGVRVRVNNFFSKTTRPRDMLFFLKDTLSIEDEKLFKACKSVCSSVC